MSDVLIGYVHTGTVHERFMRSLFSALSEDRGEHLSTFLSGSPANIAESRCNVVQRFLDEHDEEWLWFVDTDVVFPTDTHLKLLEAADAQDRPIVTAAYWTDYAEGRWLVWQVWRDDRLCPVAEMPDGLVQLSACGLGCVLIHRSVLERIRVEYKQDPWPWFGHDVIDTPDGQKRLGEDFTFCVRALKCGFPIHGLNFPVEHRKVCTLGVPEHEMAVT